MTGDLRLAPAALAAWAAAWWLCGEPAAAGGLAVAGAWALAVAGVVTLTLARGRWRVPVLAHGLLVAACVVAVALGVHVQASARAPLEALAEAGATARLTGRVVSEPRPAAFGGDLRWVLSVESVTARGTTVRTTGSVEVTAPPPAPAYGATVATSARLRPDEPGRDTAARARAEEAVVVAPPGAVLAGTQTLRSALLEVTAHLSPQARGLVPGAAVGDTTRVPPELTEAMRVTGLTHVTAVSGGHFAVVVATLTAACAALRAPRAVRVVLLVGAAVGFVLLVRPEPSVLRAAWTCAVALLGLALGRPSAGPAALATASTVLLVVDPWLARSFGFALSCAATAGLVLVAGPLARRLAPWLGRPLAFALAVPLAAQAAVGPVLVLLDPTVPTTAVLANLLAAPALVPATVLGLLATVLAPGAPGLAHAVAWLAGLATGWIAVVARWCAGLPGASVPWPGGTGGALLLAAVTAAALVGVLRRPVGQGWPRAWRELGPRTWRRARGRRASPLTAVGFLLGVPLVVLVVALVLPRALTTGSGVPADWEVVACDVGQGDALVVRTGAASAVVVDVGPPGDAAGRCLDRLGVARVDLLVLSHFHADHVGGLEPVLAGRAVRSALVSPLEEPASAAARVRGVLADAGVPVETATPGRSGSLGATSWRVLAARDDGSGAGEEGDGANDASVVLALRTPAGVDVVALGDLERAGQDALLADLRASGWPGGVDVVKMAHHGSAAQSQRLAALLRPRVTLVSVGDDNTYGHPTDAALDLYGSAGSAIVRTDECGTAVLVVRDGELGLSCTR